MFRAIFFMAVIFFDTVIAAFAAIIFGTPNPYSKLMTRILRLWAKIIVLGGGIRVEVRGQENFDAEKSYIIVANHQSHTDIPICVGYLNLPIRIIAKKELFKIPVFNWGMRAAGIIEIDRGNRKRALETLKQAEKIIKTNKLSILAFPEGTRSKDGKLQPFKKGPIMLALNSGLPILPVAISGTFSRLSRNTLKVKPGKVMIQIQPPISTESLEINDRHQLTKDAEAAIARGFIENF